MRWGQKAAAAALILAAFLAGRRYLEAPRPLTIPSVGSDPSSPDSTGTQQHQTLPVDGNIVTAWVSLSPHCPISNNCIPQLNRLAAEYRSQKARIVGIVPGHAASPARMRQYVDELQIQFDLVHDANHSLCRQLQMTHTPQTVVTGYDGERIYSGRIDDRFTRVAGSSQQARDETLRHVIDFYLSRH